MEFVAKRTRFDSKQWGEKTDVMKCSMGNTVAKNIDAHYASGECGELLFHITGPDKTVVELIFKGALKHAGFAVQEISYPNSV